MTGSRSHKLVTSDVSRILWLYYNDSVRVYSVLCTPLLILHTQRTLFAFCAGNELFFVALYLMKWIRSPIGLDGSFDSLTWPQVLALATFPIFLGKNIINVVQLWKASKILVGVDLAEREQARLEARSKQ